jgi:hypothetical protein
MPWWNAQNQFKKQPSEKGPKKAEVDSAAFIGMERGVQLSMSGKTS